MVDGIEMESTKKQLTLLDGECAHTGDYDICPSLTTLPCCICKDCGVHYTPKHALEKFIGDSFEV